MTIGFKCTIKIYFLPSISGKSTSISLSNLPGRVRAGSRTSFWFVAANTMTFEFDSNPSIYTKSWFNVLSLSSFPLIPAKIKINFTWSFFSNCINFIDEDDWRGSLFCLLEEISHSLCTHSHIHLDKLTSADCEKWNVTFPCACFSNHGRPGSWWPSQ